MIEETERARDAAWDSYQERLGNRTEGEETAIRAAFRAGWSAAGRWRMYQTPSAGLVAGVGRDSGIEAALVLYCTRRPSDAELRAIHDAVRVIPSRS